MIRIPAAWYVTAGALALAGWQALAAYSARTELAEMHAAAAEETVRRIESMQGVTRYANQSRARILADSGAAAAAADRLRQQVRALLARSPAVAPGGETAGDACSVLSELLGAADARLRELARIADERGAAGAACERAWNALTR